MIRRIGSFVVLLLVATLALAACGKEDNKPEPTVTRIPVEGAPSKSPTSAPATTGGAKASPPAAGAASPKAGTSASPVSGASKAASPVGGTAGSETGSSLHVEMVDIAFVEKELTVPANTEVTIKLTNTGAAAHNFSIKELGVDSGQLAAGQTGEVKFNTGAPGEYTFFCDIPGHKEAGMVGKLIVQ
jgi:plastocyanin